jgi:glycosyltransferase involved in cell wall biosynthesis
MAMRILHIENTAGVATLLSRGESILGHESDVLETWPSYATFYHDYEHPYGGSYYRTLWQMKRTIDLAKKYDIIHVHAGMARKRIDYPWIRNFLGKPFVVHYHGSESRMGYGMHYQNLADAKVVATPDLLHYHPKATFIPNPMMPMEAEWSEGELRFLHLPNDRVAKGTEHILRAVRGLEAEGRRVSFTLRERIPHDEALKEIARSNIIIDQVSTHLGGAGAGLMGTVSLEGMAMGKAVICSLDPNKYGRYYPPGYPGIYADEKTIKDVMSSLLDDPQKVRELGERGRKWISDYFRPEIIARQHVEIYERVMGMESSHITHTRFSRSHFINEAGQ